MVSRTFGSLPFVSLSAAYFAALLANRRSRLVFQRRWRAVGQMANISASESHSRGDRYLTATRCVPSPYACPRAPRPQNEGAQRTCTPHVHLLPERPALVCHMLAEPAAAPRSGAPAQGRGKRHVE